MRNVFKIRRKQVKEVLRCQIPHTLPIPRKKLLLEGFMSMQMALMDEQTMHLELYYREELWKFEMNKTHAVSFNSDCIWVPDNKLQTLIPFNLHYITEVYATIEFDFE